MFFETNNLLRETQDVFRDRTTLDATTSVEFFDAYLTKTVPSYGYMINSCDGINSDECVSRVEMFCKCKQKDNRSRLVHSQKSGGRNKRSGAIQGIFKKNDT